ncbi:MAG TPA: MFS transporter, partial [Ktedonobacterales bacterium]|nr:MFS transporter [Ktedonobacterales bacterium]
MSVSTQPNHPDIMPSLVIADQASPLASPTPAQILTVGARRRWTLAYWLYIVGSNIDFTNVVWLIYLAGRGYSPLAIGLFEMLFHLAKFLAEAPTGVFADLVGRRASLIVSCALCALATLLLLIPTTPVIALSFALSGVSWAFKGGAQEAVVWALAQRSGGADSIAQRYSRLFSRTLVVLLIAGALGEASGGYLLRLNVAVPFLCRAVALVIAIAPLLLIPETRARQSAHDDQTSHRAGRPLEHLRAGLAAAWRNPTLLALLLLSGLEAAIFTTTGY